VHSTALLANAIWGASNLPAYCRFRRALHHPQSAQQQWLRKYLATNAATEFGRKFGFSSIRTYAEFKNRVPVGDYDCFEPWIDRIRRGQPNILTRDRATHLVPTSGSSGGRKLIPFTAGLQRDFNAAIGPWLLDLQKQFPAILCGPAYWSITPAFQQADLGQSAVPIGFESDLSYVGSGKERLARAAMAVPASVLRTTSLEEFRRETLLHLLACRDLRLISVWHPSFLVLLLEALAEHWSWLLDRLTAGSVGAGKERVRELLRTAPNNPKQLWPKLSVISSWGEGSAEPAIGRILQLLPGVNIQRKGLLATEGVITIPFGGKHVLAVTSHFFEFLDSSNDSHPAHELSAGDEYEVLITTNGGLCRYRLRDRVKVTGFVHGTPCLSFVGRAGIVSDRCGEKLSEPFVSNVIRELLTDCASIFALLAPDGETNPNYTLYLQGIPHADTTLRLDRLLKQNPQYALCRDLGQLHPPRVFVIKGGGYEQFVARELSKGVRFGDVKPASLSKRSGWTDYFTGEYFDVRPGNTVAEVALRGRA
jgi:hypothetical protein